MLIHSTVARIIMLILSTVSQPQEPPMFQFVPNASSCHWALLRRAWLHLHPPFRFLYPLMRSPEPSQPPG